MKTISKKILIATAALLALQGAAFAQSSSGWYVGGSVGASQIKPKIDDLGPGANEDTSSTGYKIFAGYQFTPTWAAEFQLQNLGKYKRSEPGFDDVRVSDRGFSIAAVGQIPVAENLAVLGKVGIARHSFKSEETTGGYGEEKLSKTSALIGVGLEYSLTTNVRIRAEYEYFGAPKWDDVKIRTGLLSVGVRYQF